MKERETLAFIEPDFEFEFHPSYNLVESGEYFYAAPGHEMSVAIVEWKVNLWKACRGWNDHSNCKKRLESII